MKNWLIKSLFLLGPIVLSACATPIHFHSVAGFGAIGSHVGTYNEHEQIKWGTITQFNHEYAVSAAHIGVFPNTVYVSKTLDLQFLNLPAEYKFKKTQSVSWNYLKENETLFLKGYSSYHSGAFRIFKAKHSSYVVHNHFLYPSASNTILPGMSGGSVENQMGEKVGISIGNVRFEGRMIFISYQEIEKEFKKFQTLQK